MLGVFAIQNLQQKLRIRGESLMVHPVKVGRRTRMSFSKIKEVIDMPNLIELQLDSYKSFLAEDLREVFSDVNPITDYTGNLVLEFIDYKLDYENIKYTVEECKERDATYAAPLKVKVRLVNKETGEVKDQEVFMGDFPLMTEQGTFIINGAERVIVSQLVRSPGVYYGETIDKSGKKLYSSTVIPNRGAWIEYETDSNDILYVRLDRTRKLPLTVFTRALGLGSDSEIIQFFGDDERLKATIEKDNTKTVMLKKLEYELSQNDIDINDFAKILFKKKKDSLTEKQIEATLSNFSIAVDKYRKLTKQ